MRNTIAKILSYAWPVLAIGYIVGFSYYFVEWLETIEQDKFEMAMAMPIWLLGIVALFVIHHFYGKLVGLIKK